MTDPVRTAPASFGQRRLWFFDRLQPRSSVYNTHSTIHLQGQFDREALERTAHEMVRRHEVFRTTFRSIDGSPVQVIHPPGALPLTIPLTDLSDMPDDRRELETKRILLGEFMRVSDLERGPLIHLVLLRLEARRHILSIAVHHIIYDDWSVEVFDREFKQCYADAKAGQAFSLPELPMQFSTFSAEQYARFAKGSIDPQLTYWRERLRNLPDPIALPTDKPRGTGQTFPGAIRKIFIDTETSQAFRALTRSANATMFMSLFAAFAVLLSRFSGDTDLIVGTPMANRNRPELANLIGFFVNTLVLRIALGDDPSFVELLTRTRDMALGAFANQDVPYELLVEELRPTREANRQPLIQTMFIYLSARVPMDGSGPKDMESSGAKFDLAMTGIDAPPNICGELEYNTDLFDKVSMARMAACFETLIASIVAEPTLPVSKLSLLPETERERILNQGRGPRVEMPTACVHEIVRGVAAAEPDAIAVTFGPMKVTYGALVRRADAISAHLRSLQLEPETRVGLLMERTPDWVAGMLGILDAGCAIVPLDPALPLERLAFMMEDADVSIVLTERRLTGRIEAADVRSILLDVDVADSIAARPASKPTDLNALAYVIFTSGSTGRPKGVMVGHCGLTNLALAQGDAWRVGSQSRVLQFASLGFDAAMSEVFSTLCRGGHLCLAPAADTMPGPRLLRTLRDLRITHITLPPSALAAMQPETLPDLAVVISAGERLEPDLARRWVQGRRLFNAYGPTEATVCATMHECAREGDDTSIGRPIANVDVQILDRNGAPVPTGVSGEVCIGGRGIARGYVGRPELTNERFVDDPFAATDGGRLYRSGDRGRYDAKGALHYLGRVDTQLKIRGYRIEPGEIESVLRTHAQVGDALVLGQGTGADARLVAYIIADGAPPLIIELRSFLARQLPDYMTPAVFLMVEEWPKTPNGKIDRAALPRPDARTRDIGARVVAPANGMEEAIAATWCECLEVKQVGTNDNFFDLGGHSLMLVKVYDKLKDRFSLDLSLIDMFRFPTIKSQATMLADKLADSGEDKTLGRTDQRAARQNAARQQRRQRVEIQRNV